MKKLLHIVVQPLYNGTPNVKFRYIAMSAAKKFEIRRHYDCVVVFSDSMSFEEILELFPFRFLWWRWWKKRL
ncbi:hypothetical protein ACE6H2_012195 [Prunus campanulata]